MVERNYENGSINKNGIIGEKYRNGRISRTDELKYRKRSEWKNRRNDETRWNRGGGKSSRKGKIEEWWVDVQEGVKVIVKIKKRIE